MTPATLAGVPNAPGTARRTVRVSDELWLAAQAMAADEGRDVSSYVRADLERRVKRWQRKTKEQQ